MIYFIDILLYRRGGLTRRTFVFGPMTDDDGVGLHADAERCRRDLDKNVHVSGPVTDSAISLAVERYRRDLDDSLVAIVYGKMSSLSGSALPMLYMAQPSMPGEDSRRTWMSVLATSRPNVANMWFS